MDNNTQEKNVRQRGENWTQAEKDILLEIMRDSASIIENKATDTNNNKRKAMEWLKVQRRLKELFGKQRDVNQIKGFWRRIKMTAAKNIADHKKTVKTTGGGDRPPPPSENDLMIMDLCPTNFISEQNEFDSDGIYMVVENKESESENKNVNKTNTLCDIDIEILDDNENSSIEENIAVENKIENVKITPKKSVPESGKRRKAETSNKAAIIKSNIYFKRRMMQMMAEEHHIKMKYHRRELCHQQQRHKLEYEILLLDKEEKYLKLIKLKKPEE